jgi:superfamily II DNA helicase RecQ
MSTEAGGRSRFKYLRWETMLEFDGLSNQVINEAAQLLGDRLRDWQAVAVSRMLQGRDVIIKAGTGSGKSWSYYSMAAAKKGGIVLVLAPLKSIMETQVCMVD